MGWTAGGWDQSNHLMEGRHWRRYLPPGGVRGNRADLLCERSSGEGRSGAVSHYYAVTGRRWAHDRAESYWSHLHKAERHRAPGTPVTRAEMTFGPGSGLWLESVGRGSGRLAAHEGQQQVVNYLFFSQDNPLGVMAESISN